MTVRGIETLETLCWPRRAWILGVSVLLTLPLSVSAEPASPAEAFDQSEAESESAQELAAMLIRAHGGMETWRAAPSVSFEHKLVIPGVPEPWLSYEVTEQGGRRSYQDWILDEARIAFDGERTWSLDWSKGNPPRFMVNLAYYFLNLPWLTQDAGVHLESGVGKLAEDDREYPTLRMTFDAGVGDTPGDYYVIFIDPESRRMKAVEYVVTYGAVLDLFGAPPEATFIGPFVHIYDEYAEVDGLAVPVEYHTVGSDGTVYGKHWVSRWSFREPFDEGRLVMPAGAVVDKSSTERGQGDGR